MHAALYAIAYQLSRCCVVAGQRGRVQALQSCQRGHGRSDNVSVVQEKVSFGREDARAKSSGAPYFLISEGAQSVWFEVDVFEGMQNEVARGGDYNEIVVGCK